MEMPLTGKLIFTGVMLGLCSYLYFVPALSMDYHGQTKKSKFYSNLIAGIFIWGFVFGGIMLMNWGLYPRVGMALFISFAILFIIGMVGMFNAL